MNSSIIKSSDLSATLYYENNALFLLTDSKKTIIAEKIQPIFSVVASSGKNIILFYRESSGNAYLTNLLSSKKDNSRQLCSLEAFENSYTCILGQSSALNSFFVYTNLSGERNMLHLLATDLSDNQNAKIDSILPINGQDFYFFQGQNLVLIYRNEQNMLILCVFDGNSLIQNTKYTLSRRADCISDISCLIVQDCIHICYIIKQKDTSYLIYKQLKNNTLSKNQILNSGETLEFCTLFIAEDTLFAFNHSKNITYYSFSTDLGLSFYPSSIYFKRIYPTGKAKYISTLENGFIAQEILMDNNAPLLLKDFSTQDTETVEINLETIKTLTGKTINLEKEIKEKNLQISKLTKTVNEAQQQGSVFMQQLRGRCDEIAQDNNRLSQLVATLTHERDKLALECAAKNAPPSTEISNEDVYLPE